MALLSEEREKASEARQFTFTKNLFDAKTVFPFCARCIRIISRLQHTALWAALTLHDLKEAPDVSGWSPYRQSLCKNAGPQNTTAEV